MRAHQNLTFFFEKAESNLRKISSLPATIEEKLPPAGSHRSDFKSKQRVDVASGKYMVSQLDKIQGICRELLASSCGFSNYKIVLFLNDEVQNILEKSYVISMALRGRYSKRGGNSHSQSEYLPLTSGNKMVPELRSIKDVPDGLIIIFCLLNLLSDNKESLLADNKFNIIKLILDYQFEKTFEFQKDPNYNAKLERRVQRRSIFSYNEKPMPREENSLVANQGAKVHSRFSFLKKLKTRKSSQNEAEQVAELKRIILAGDNKKLGKFLEKMDQNLMLCFFEREKVTPLYYALSLEKIQCAEVLIKYDDINQKMKESPFDTVSHYICLYGSESALRFLEQNNADFSIPNMNGVTPRELLFIRNNLPNLKR